MIDPELVEHITGETPIILPTPVPIILPVDSKIIVFTKFLSWLTASLLAVAVIISLVSVTNDRNALRTQISAQSVELACRSAASTDTNKAEGERDNTIAELLTYMAQNDTVSLQTIIPVLQLQIVAVSDALAAQEKALEACDKR